MYESIRIENRIVRIRERINNLKNLIKTHAKAEIHYLADNRVALANVERDERERYESMLKEVESELESLKSKA